VGVIWNIVPLDVRVESDIRKLVGSTIVIFGTGDVFNKDSSSFNRSRISFIKSCSLDIFINIHQIFNFLFNFYFNYFYFNYFYFNYFYFNYFYFANKRGIIYWDWIVCARISVRDLNEGIGCAIAQIRGGLYIEIGLFAQEYLCGI
jgi:hypothetical protein